MNGNGESTTLIVGEGAGMSHAVSTPGLRRILADPEAPSRRVSLNNRGSTCALACCTMATFPVPFVPS